VNLVRKQILPLLAFWAVAWAQVFGMQRAFVCDHQGDIVVTEAEHCHRASAEGSKTFTHCEGTSDNGCDEESDTEHHSRMVEEMQSASSTLAMVSIPLYVAVLVSDLPVYDHLFVRTLAENVGMTKPSETEGNSPPVALQVARCLVILV